MLRAKVTEYREELLTGRQLFHKVKVEPAKKSIGRKAALAEARRLIAAKRAFHEALETTPLCTSRWQRDLIGYAIALATPWGTKDRPAPEAFLKSLSNLLDKTFHEDCYVAPDEPGDKMLPEKAVAKARAAVKRGDHAEAARLFDVAVACMQAEWADYKSQQSTKAKKKRAVAA